nr:hypothetical protein [Nakamurella multipartita]
MVEVPGELQCFPEPGCADLEVCAGLGEARFDPSAFLGNLVGPGRDLAAVERSVRGQVDKPFLAGGEPGQLGTESCLQLLGDGLLFAQGVGDGPLGTGHEAVGDRQGLVVLGDGVLDVGHRQMSEVAGLLLPSSA